MRAYAVLGVEAVDVALISTATCVGGSVSGRPFPAQPVTEVDGAANRVPLVQEGEGRSVTCGLAKGIGRHRRRGQPFVPPATSFRPEPSVERL